MAEMFVRCWVIEKIGMGKGKILVWEEGPDTKVPAIQEFESISRCPWVWSQ